MDYKFPNNEQAILRTLLYSDIFSFPVTRDELWQFLLSKRKVSSVAYTTGLSSLVKQKIIAYKDGYYCLSGNEQSIVQRKRDMKEVQKKLLLAQKVASVLSHIPTIQCIGLSGGLAVESATDADDIDFFIITKRRTLFTTRLWIASVLSIMGLRRTWNAKKAANKICVNFLIDETKLAWSSQRHDVYSAREIAQLKPLFNRETTYETFILSNAWIEQFLPHWEQQKQLTLLERKQRRSIHYVLIWNPVCEWLVRRFQQVYMGQHRTNERIENSVLAFHPNDYRSKVLKKLNSKWEQFGLLTNF